MNDELSRAMERVRQNRTAGKVQVDATHAHQTTQATRASGTFVAGDRVFDIVTGHEGYVENTAAINRKPAGLVPVRLDNGTLITRLPSDLVWRPTPPTSIPAGKR